MNFWTAGQRIDLTTESRFVWRVITSTDRTTYGDMVSEVGYTNWHPEEPNGGDREACLKLVGTRSYKWNDRSCSDKLCSVCEIDMS